MPREKSLEERIQDIEDKINQINVVGFFGKAPVTKQTATATAASILALLKAYGLSN